MTSISLENRIAAEALGAATFVHITTLAVLVDALHPISQLLLDAVKVGDQRGNSSSDFSGALVSRNRCSRSSRSHTQVWRAVTQG